MGARAHGDMAWKVGTSLDKGPFELLGEGHHGDFVANFQAHVAAGNFDPVKSRTVLEYLAERV